MAAAGTCRSIAASPGLLTLMEQAPPNQRKPVLLLAALHERVLAGVTAMIKDTAKECGQMVWLGSQVTITRVEPKAMCVALVMRPARKRLVMLRE